MSTRPLLESWSVSREYRASVLPPAVKACIGVERAATFDWERYVGDCGHVIDGMSNSYAFGSLTSFAASPDGNRVAATENAEPARVSLWKKADDSFTQTYVDPFWSDVAISADGSIVAPVTGGMGFAGAAADFPGCTTASRRRPPFTRTCLRRWMAKYWEPLSVPAAKRLCLPWETRLNSLTWVRGGWSAG